MYPGLLDVLHDPRDPYVLAVAQRVDVDLDRVLEETVQVDRGARGGADALQVIAQPGDAVDDLHRASPEHVARTNQQWEADVRGALQRLLRRARGRVPGGPVAEAVQQRAKPGAILGEVDRVDARAQDRHPAGLQAGGELERRLAAELDDHPERLLDLAHRQHVLERQ